MRRRYLAIRVESEGSVNRGEVTDAIWKAVGQLFGEYGASQLGMVMIEYDEQRSHGVVRCSHKTLPMLKASIASITKINGKSTAIRVLRVSGTLKALHKKYRFRQ